MTHAIKARIAAIFLSLMLVWPLVHHGLVEAVGMSPWNLSGWSMYCVPKSQLFVEMYRIDEGKRSSVGRVGPEVAVALRRFASRRHILGRWVSPERLGQALRDHLEGEEGAMIVVKSAGIDRRSLHIEVIEEQRFTF